ncbi:aldose 1-epimerase family protein [Paraoerskovia marina]|uniref:aldose 1-epimerase family protein n=1 Tax=Paraoerskovia marina TaxID=545619 RepID=UPI0004925F9E|nr:aldose 1-epimerase family protein [Paraoerskovia marina]
MTVFLPSGLQLPISFGDQHAVVTEVGAALRSYTSAGADVVVPFAETELAPASHGAVLLPWPNRLGDGTYEFDGVRHQAPVNETARTTALHGLACWVRWSVAEHTTSSVTLALDLAPQPGYPFGLSAQISYTLADDGLTVELLATNTGTGDLPYGSGFHPWLSPQGADLDECTLRLDAATHVTVDERLLPTGSEPVAGDFDLRTPRVLADLDLDDAWLDPARDSTGRSRAVLTRPDGSGATVWAAAWAQAWQVCTGDHVGDTWSRTGVAVEPMSCIADAFRTGDLLVRLAPGESHVSTWGITPH